MKCDMDYLELYINFLKKFLKLERALKVVFDCSNGTTGKVLKELFRVSSVKRQVSRVKPILINDRPDGRFPAHGPDPWRRDAFNDLRTAVRKHKADLGIIFDADGDRVFFLDDRGQPVAPDAVAVLISRSFKGPLILDVRAGYLARELISADGKKIINSRVGHYFIKKLMNKKKIDFAAETSGHYYFKFKEFSAVWDSGILTAIYFMNQISGIRYQGLSLGEWIDGLPKYHRSGEINFRVSDKEKILTKIEQKYKKEAQRLSHLDGLKMEFGAWWFNVRPSQTEDLLRLNLEAKDKKTFLAKLKEFKKLISG